MIYRATMSAMAAFFLAVIVLNVATAPKPANPLWAAYAKWQLPETREDAIWLAWNADPKPADKAYCVYQPWLPQCQLPPVRDGHDSL